MLSISYGQYYMQIAVAIKPIERGNFTGSVLPKILLAWPYVGADYTPNLIEIPYGCVTRLLAIG